MLQNEASFETLCFKYVKEFFKDNIKLRKQKIIENINYNLQESYNCLSELVNIILTFLNNIQKEKYANINTKVNKQNTNEDNINYNYKQYTIILNFFKFINNYLTEKEVDKNINSQTGIKSMPNSSRLNIKKCKSIINLNDDKFKLKNTIKFYETNNNYNSNLRIIYNNENYKKIQEFSSPYKEIFKPLLLKCKITIPYLPPIDKNKYKYTLVIDLDETLVHYIEEDDKSFIQVRPYVSYFLTEMGKYFELVIFTAAEMEYANFVLDELDKNNLISHKLYRRHTKYKNGIFLKDLSKIGRDLNKICIIDNNRANYSLQPFNGINISSFMGEQNDEELLFLSCQLMKIIDSNKKDIRPIIKEINENMNIRYSNSNY
jgi:CTD small phosphatase-like protein 2